ncbi:hypothetical protein LTR75_010456 [Friedmanniomyces endolithicus]|nr:hypothetical protein LTR75_010456 [Friedmanniomyces endolithicus]KAK0811147.1 hypothetical protein LTR38_003752 [Friedmanniomyces endolithicus]KAK0839891.1 hypothetical protein LTR03_010978 [Friedmanniomyces endolithicus]
MDNAAPETEAELEAFRQRWRDEVSARNKRPDVTERPSHVVPAEQRRKAAPTLPSVPEASAARRKDATDYSEEIEPRVYHDLPDKEEQLRLGAEGQAHDRDAAKEPSSALEHYEHAVERENIGLLGDSISHYRKAFKVCLLSCISSRADLYAELDSGVQEAYKRKHFPPSAFVKPKPVNPNPSGAAVTVPGTAHHSLHGSALPPTLKQLVEEFADLRIKPPPPATEGSPPERSLLGELPEEILSQILRNVAIKDVASFARMAQVCKRLAFLVLTEEAIWKRVAIGHEFGFAAMHYDFICDVEGFPTEANDEIARYLGAYDELPSDLSAALPTPEDRALAFSTLTHHLLHTTYASSWRQLFRSRPRLRFNGCYISTVNYTRAGATSTNTLSWGQPVHVVTYFRYLRFFRDGTAISLLTTAEPTDVVHYLLKENLHAHHHRQDSMLPSAVMKDALRGRWRLSGPASSVRDAVTGEAEVEGEVHVETEGVVPKYTYRMHFALAQAGKGARNNKLAWKGFWSHNRLTEDCAVFTLKNDRAFYWSRVKSYKMGY